MELDDAYANRDYIPNADAYPPRWDAAAEALRAELQDAGRALIDVPYGGHERERLDLFLPEGSPEGLVVFVHGGYWRAFDKSSWSHLAAGPLARGWAVAMPSYTLAPEARIAQITRQVADAIPVAAAKVAGPIVLTGHSAGGHLVARMGAPGMLSAEVTGRVERIVPISPLSDLRPLRKTSMNDDFRMSESDAEAESPILQPAPGCAVTVWVGRDERPAFLDQAQWLADAWGADLVVTDGEHHFNVIDGLGDPEGALCRTVCGVAAED